MRRMRASGNIARKPSSTRCVPRPSGWMSTLPQVGHERGMRSSRLQWWQRSRFSGLCSTMKAVQRVQSLIQPQASHEITGA